MDKYEYKIREDEIKELIAQREFDEAAEVADTIDWRRVKSVKMLCMVSDVYKKMRRYEDSRDMLLLAYDRHPGGRTIVYSLCELAIKMGELGQALEYCKEFIQIAPKDPGRYILQYKLYEAQEVGLEERIAVLEELKKKDYREKWAYELALMYHKVGMETRCVEECDELILWFGEGKYVIKAMELKMQHQPLSELQQEKYDSFFRQEEEPEEMPEVPQENVMEAETTRVPVEDIDIQVKTLGLSQADTINLQAEVAAGLQELLAKQGNAPAGYEEDAPTRRMTAPMGKVIDWATAEMVTSEIITDVEAVTINTVQPKQVQPVVEQVAEETVSEVSKEAVVPQEPVEEIAETLEETAEELTIEEPAKETNEEIILPETLDWQAEESLDSVQEAEQIVLPIADVAQNAGLSNVEPPKEMAKVLSMEGDGQISFVMPETVALEKQITGQMNFNDIMLEWERMKLELEEKRKENVRQIVLRNTGAMFTEFEASVRDGLLEQLENGKTMEEILPQAENLDPVQVEALVDTEDNAEEYEEIKDTVEELTDIEEEIPEAVEEFEELGEIPESEEETETTEEIPEAVEEFEELEEVAEIPEDMSKEDVSAAIEEVVEPEAAEATETAAVEEAVKEAEEPETIEEAMEDAEEAMDIVEEFVEDADDEDSDDDSEADGSDEDDEDADEDAEAGEEDSQDETSREEEIKVKDEELEEEKERTSGRSLTKEEKELFAPFIQGRESRRQLIQALDAISLAAYTGNVVITGREGLDTIGLAKSLVREIQQNDNNFSGKVAKISGASLNKRDVEEIMGGLVNGALIVQKAGDINEDTAKSLYKILQQENRGIIVILEGTKRAMNTFFEKYGLLESCFNARIDMEALSDDALVAFANKYAREHECSIDEFGMLALHRTIADRQTSDHAVTILEVKEIMDDAIASANRKTIGHFFSILAAKRYDDEDMVIIRENDFV